MAPADLAQRYFDAWNRHDSPAIVETFASGGTYTDPAAGTLPGPAVGQYAVALVGAFPDLRFDIESHEAAGDGRTVAQWVMRGTNHGSFGGAPPTGNEIALPGIDVIDSGPDGIRSVRGYFDQRTLVEQLGLQAIVVPYTAGPFSFGVASRVHSGNTARPGAVSVTWLDAATDDQRDYVRDASRVIATRMLRMPGFISWYGVIIGKRMLTLTAWENAEHVREIMRDETHRQGVKKVFQGDVAAAMHTGIWAPNHLNPLYQRCAGCGQLVNVEQTDGCCSCGAALDQRPAWL